jgi:Protein of unknown function (DUF3455)
MARVRCANAPRTDLFLGVDAGMTRFTRLCRAVGVGLAVVTATLAMTQVAHAELPPPTGVPPTIMPDIKTNEVFLVGHVLDGKGFQIYTCDPVAGKWSAAVPQAELSNDQKVPIIKHFAGPTWQELPNGSTVVGTKKAAVDDLDGNGIPWLLLSATKTTAGRGGHLLSDTTFIQRLNTIGGLQPTDPCNASTTPLVRPIPYTADYYFWKATGKP